ncbi:MAG: Ni/Fe hydrogenase subunit alpha [Elusimicrobiota bacterium]
MSATTSKKITIDPITRLEGHGKIVVFLKDSGDVDHAYLQIPEYRGFEKFAEGRPAEDLPQITERICGVCPTAHHMASSKCLDDLYRVEPPPAGRKIRELVYNAFVLEDHALHFVYLGGPDFVVGPKAPKAERNVLGVIGKLGIEAGKKVINARKAVRGTMTKITGKAIHPAFGLPGGISKAIDRETRDQAVEAANLGLDLAKTLLSVFESVVLKNKEYVDLVLSDGYTHKTYYMGMVDKDNKVNFYDGDLRVVAPDGKEFRKFKPAEYLKHVCEHVEPWSYIKFPYLKDIGWKGFVDGPESGVYCVAPLARLNAADGMATPLAQAEYEKYFKTLGGKPVHYTLANHWARLIELLYAAERMIELANDPEILDGRVRVIPTATPKEGIGAVEAPRGTLLHHYETDEKGLIRKANLIVATGNNAARIAMSVDKAAKACIKGGKVDDGIMNMIEMSFRAYDPCFGCATHCLPGTAPMVIELRDLRGGLLRTLSR